MFLQVELDLPAPDVAAILCQPARWLPEAEPTDDSSDTSRLRASLSVGGHDRTLTVTVVSTDPSGITLEVEGDDPALGTLACEIGAVPRTLDSCTLDLLGEVASPEPSILHPLRTGRTHQLAGALLDHAAATIRHQLEGSPSAPDGTGPG